MLQLNPIYFGDITQSKLLYVFDFIYARTHIYTQLQIKKLLIQQIFNIDFQHIKEYLKKIIYKFRVYNHGNNKYLNI